MQSLCNQIKFISFSAYMLKEYVKNSAYFTLLQSHLMLDLIFGVVEIS